MSHKLTDVLLAGLETTRGTAAGSLALHLPLVLPGFTPQRTGHVAEVIASSTFPEITEQVAVGVSHTWSLAPDINRDTIRDLFLWATYWDGGRPALTLARTRMGIAQERYLGCVVTRFDYGYSRSASPGDDAILTGTLSGDCMGKESTTGVSAGTQAVARHFSMNRGTFTINGVAATEILSYRASIELLHSPGPPDADGKRLWSVDGIIRHTREITAKFSSAALSTLLEGQTDHSCVFVHATGTANETVTETLGKSKIVSHSEADDAGLVTQTNSFVHSHTGAAAANVITFGSAIGAGELGIGE